MVEEDDWIDEGENLTMTRSDGSVSIVFPKDGGFAYMHLLQGGHTIQYDLAPFAHKGVAALMCDLNYLDRWEIQV